MLGFPKTTDFGRVIPKEKFYQKMNVDTALEKLFISDIEKIIWQNKLSSKTINVDVGKKVIEIDVLEIRQKTNAFNYKLIEFIDKNAPHHTVFVLTFEGKSQICISYKEGLENKEGKFKINAFYKTEYSETDNLTLDITGLNLDKVYENFILQVAGDRLKFADDVSIKDAITKLAEIEKLEKEIVVLENRIRKEKQFNVQVRLNGELRKLKEKMEGLSNGNK